MIVYKEVTKKYDDVTVVDNFNLTIDDGEFVVLIGPSGCGKTTSLKMVNRLIEMNDGAIFIDNQNINEMDAVELRRKIGYVIQQIGLFPNMNIEENITVVPKLLKWSKEKRRKRAEELLKLVGMPYEENAHKYPNELSGGQQQRIGVLRALAAEPPIILMDEPFGALDPITRENLQDELKVIQKKLKKTVVFVTHDMDEAIKMADKIIFMYNGKILQAASPEEMLKNPADPVIKNFLGKRSYSSTGEDLICKDVMRTKILTVPNTKKTLECINLMKQRQINSVVVVDENERYLGVAGIKEIMKTGKPGESIEKVTNKDLKTVSVNTNAKEAFDYLMESNNDYIVVLNSDKTVAGIITESSMTNALASVVWGG
ncbi:betaine/proline/choline family ABC transporter ATP-binding protein [Alkalibacter saccharofermentans]|uniref:Quaternary amine transport ATP-binding protein n=1 Tax=Alkalibacter saccharofermentans DSM 14828 TaxID=1120975 RepID=A0A1M4U161_9FIRM|nr:betaine/proline/choline family ABC transporter ATP-binding protein [Alkalibacter saccharofermentans]SHE50344.1 osmoprotectant transport system ATP-binding protein [Alkalibacter saccharofermentans DSM 14828]